MSNSKVIGGRYEIYEKIGEGGMAIVYKAKCKLLNRFVAIKILKPEFVKDAKFIESFRRESQAAASLSHPNIVNVYDVGLEGKNIHYIVMEYIEGETLNEVIERQGRLSYEDAVSIGKQMASALSLAHKNHIIHRDVKPHNILITRDGVAKITDFGIAKAVNTTTIVNNDAVMGSVHYFSPEQARGGYVDEKSDIYSLGIVMYEMVTGQVPFDGDNPVSVAMMHINDEMRPPSEISIDIPMGLEDVILKAANKYQSNRFTSAKELYNALNRLDLSFGDDSTDRTMKKSGYSDKSATRVLDKLEGFDIIRDGEEEYEDTSEDNAVMRNKVKMSKAGNPGKMGKKKVKINKTKVGAIILGVIAALFLSKGILLAKDMITTSNEIAVPDVVGMDYAKAKETLEKANLKCEKAESVISAHYDEDQVVSQDPEAESDVKKGFVIKLTVSEGTDEGSVPDLVRLKLEDALDEIESAGFKQGTIDNEASDLPIGVVISQDPQAGDNKAKKTRINLVVSKGTESELNIMPDIVGMNVDSAKKVIEAVGLKVGTPKYEYNDKFALNEVISQSVKADSEVTANTKVDLVVSKGKEPVIDESKEGSSGTNNGADSGSTAVVGSIPVTLDFSKAKNEVFTAKIFKVNSTGNLEEVYKQTCSKSSANETVSVKGSGTGTIIVHFDDVVVMERKVDFDTGKFTD